MNAGGGFLIRGVGEREMSLFCREARAELGGLWTVGSLTNKNQHKRRKQTPTTDQGESQQRATACKKGDS